MSKVKYDTLNYSNWIPVVYVKTPHLNGLIVWNDINKKYTNTLKLFTTLKSVNNTF